jgi:hypothetical protein
VYQLLYLRHVKLYDAIKSNLKWYDGFQALYDRSSDPLWVFSLNHDLIVELITARLAMPLFTGFTPERVTLPRRDLSGKKTGEMEVEVIRQYELDNHAMRFPNPFVKGIYLLKIHGSLDIFTFNNGKDLLKLLPLTTLMVMVI